MLFGTRTVLLLTRRHFSYRHQLGLEPLRHVTIGQLLEEASRKYDYEAVISKHQNKSLTFLQVLQQADHLAKGLIDIGLEKDDRVGLWMPNSVEWIVTALACARAGFTMVGLNPAYEPPEMEYCINKVGIKSLVCGERYKKQDYYENLVEIIPELQASHPGKIQSSKVPTLQSIIMATDTEKKGLLNYEEILQKGKGSNVNITKIMQDRFNADHPFNIQFSSGTTGKPKAVMTSHFNNVNNGYLIGKNSELNTKHHKICVQVPLFHAFGITITIMSALNHGATMVIPNDTYNPDKNLDALRDEQCTVIHGTPTMYVDLVHAQEIRKEKIQPEIAVWGGAPASPHLVAKMKEILKVKRVKSIYGLTETTAMVFQSRPKEAEELCHTTVGLLSEHMEAKVIDQNGLVVPFGEPGELCLRGYANMLCYWGDAANTKKTLGDDGWLKTGDQFILQEDGYGRVIGRLKEMIIRGGENIFPKEIEDYLNTHPAILETHVVGLPHERLGEEVCACVRLKPDQSLTLEDLKAFCKGKISHFKIPTVLRIVDVFPKTLSGKIQKFKLVESATGETK